MTWNIRHGEGPDGRVDLARIAHIINREQPDFVALQEVDRGVERTARRDLPTELSALTGMTAVFRRNVSYQGGEYGNATLSRWPVIAVTNLPYRMLRAGEQRAVLQVTVEMGGRPFAIWNTHLDYRRDDAERLAHVAELSAAAARSAVPFVLCGDFNDYPSTPVHRALVEDFEDAWERTGVGPGYTFPHARPDRRIDYLWTPRSGEVRARGARVLPSEASDHLPLLVELEWIPVRGEGPAFNAQAGAGSR